MAGEVEMPGPVGEAGSSTSLSKDGRAWGPVVLEIGHAGAWRS